MKNETERLPPELRATPHHAGMGISRRTIALFGVLAGLWIAGSWFLVEGHIRDRTSALVAQEVAEARESVSVVSANMSRVLNRQQGIAAVLAASGDIKTVLASFGPDVQPSSLPLDARIAAWTRQPDLLALDSLLQMAARDIGVDSLWVMNASGDCIASSNFAETQTFVGTNYAFRDYFKAAKAGKRGQQFAVGKVVKVPGMFYSAPVISGGRFLGAVTVRTNLPSVAPAVNRENAFVADEHGVIILAADPGLEMHVLPDASYQQLSLEQRGARYQRTALEPLNVEKWGGPGLFFRVRGAPYPYVWERNVLSEHGVAVNVLAPIKGIEALRSYGIIGFLLVALSGTLLLALIFGARAYVLRVVAQRRGMEVTNENLEHLTKTDALTGCASRRHFQDRLKAELGRARRYSRECSLVAIDMDLFKSINDRHGHAGGDQALRHVSRVIRQELRSADEVGRLGGEEFALLLPETALASATALAERIREAIEIAPVQFEDVQMAVTASFGVASWKSPDESSDALMRRADKALYAAKSGGRNRVAATEPTTELRSVAAR